MHDTAAKEGILHPMLDLLCVGLLSMIAILIIFIIGINNFGVVTLGSLVTGATIINGAHFMASYRLLYISREQIERYKSASMYVPAVLIAYCVWALFRLAIAPSEEYWIQGLLIVTSLYLALHYTGQAWGMMASFAFIEKAFFEPLEKKIFLFCLKVLVVWQVVWSIYLIYGLPDFLVEIKPVLRGTTDVMALGALCAGTFAFMRMGRRIKRMPPLRVMVPFYVLFFWYALLAQHPAALLGVQISHALQYLIFPVRVEINRHQKSAAIDNPAERHLLIYTLTLGFTAVMFFVLMPWALEDGFSVYAQVLIAAINIHHFYIDGVIWKITSPVVKEDLFSHLKRV